MSEAQTCLRATLLCAALSACQASPPEPAELAARTSPQGQASPAALTEQPARSGGWLRARVAWGENPAALRMVARGFERVASGPSALALAPGGAVLLLDRLAGRVVKVDLQGRVQTVAEVPVDTEDLASDAGGAFVAFSPVRATGWVYDAAGGRAGQLTVPRIFRELVGLQLGASRRLTVQTAYQEQIDLGSPSAPLTLAAAMRTRREGAVTLPDGRGLQARVQHQQAELLIVSQPNAEAHAAVLARHSLPGAVSAARVVGASGRVACLRLEHATSTPVIAVSRRALCLELDSGELLLDSALPPPGAYVPRRDMAMGAGYLAFMQPTASGLELWRRPVTDLASAGQEAQP